MKPVLKLLLLTLLVMPLQVQAQDEPQPPLESNSTRSISVTGTGSVQVVPDMATITLGVETRRETASEALQENNTAQSALLDVLKEAGIADTDVQTAGLNLYSIYGERSDLSSEVTGYTVSNTVSVQVRDLNSLGALIEDVVAVGGNNFQGLSFGVSDPTPYRTQARVAAVEDARAKAEQLAELTGASLGNVLTIRDVSYSDVTPKSYGARVAEFDSVPVAEGSQEINVTVEISWFLE